MRGRNLWGALVVGVEVCWGGGIAQAHLRDYVINQNYYTTKRGEFEVELYNDMNFTDANNDDTYNSTHQLELEYGLFDHLQLAYYEVYAWDREHHWERDELKLEGKLRLAEAGQWPVDVAYYVEYANPNGHRRIHSDTVEQKLILSKDFGLWNVVTNLIAEKKINAAEGWAWEYTAGVSYGLTPRTRLGLEWRETLGDRHEFGWHRESHEIQLVPGVFTSLTDHLRLLAGVAFGLTKASDDIALKSIVEWEF